MTNDKNDVYVKFAKNIPIALVCDGEKHSFQGLSETCVCGKEKANITRIEVGEIANQVSVADMLMAEGSKEEMDELRIKYMKSQVKEEVNKNIIKVTLSKEEIAKLNSTEISACIRRAKLEQNIASLVSNSAVSLLRDFMQLHAAADSSLDLVFTLELQTSNEDK